jgi:hypothetical protein
LQWKYSKRGHQELFVIHTPTESCQFGKIADNITNKVIVLLWKKNSMLGECINPVVKYQLYSTAKEMKEQRQNGFNSYPVCSCLFYSISIYTYIQEY